MGHGSGNTQKYTKDLTSHIKSDIINDKNIKSKYYNGRATLFAITKERVDGIPIVKLNTLSNEDSAKLQQAGKDLLHYMENDPIRLEGLIAYDMNMNEIERHKGDSQNLSVSIPRYDDDCIVIHNHPSGLIFSPQDLETFSFNDEIRILGAIGNNGSVYYIEKTDDFDDLQFDFDFHEIKEKYGINSLKDYNSNNLFKIIEEILERGNNSGFKTYIITNKNDD